MVVLRETPVQGHVCCGHGGAGMAWGEPGREVLGIRGVSHRRTCGRHSDASHSDACPQTLETPAWCLVVVWGQRVSL